jgi:hypothetical protein
MTAWKDKPLPAMEWTARCNCYAGGSGHSSNSGRCGNRDWTNGIQGPGGVCTSCWTRCREVDRARVDTFVEANRLARGSTW